RNDGDNRPAHSPTTTAFSGAFGGPATPNAPKNGRGLRKSHCTPAATAAPRAPPAVTATSPLTRLGPSTACATAQATAPPANAAATLRATLAITGIACAARRRTT